MRNRSPIAPYGQFLRDILELYDYVRAKMKDVFNEQGGKFLKWEVVDQRSSTHFYFAPNLESVPYRVPDGWFIHCLVHSVSW